MQLLKRITVLTDFVFGFGLLFVLFFLWCWKRTAAFTPSLLLALFLAALLLYAFFLMSRRNRSQISKCSKVRHSVYALTMLSEEEAMDYAYRAFAVKYDLILPQRPVKGTPVTAVTKEGRQMQLFLHNLPLGPGIEVIHSIHKQRAQFPAVLLCTAAPQTSAVHHAEALSPPLRLVMADTLPLDASLIERFPLPQSPKKKRTVQGLLTAVHTQTARCLTFSLGMILFYLLTGRIGILFPALGLFFLILISKTGIKQDNFF